MDLKADTKIDLSRTLFTFTCQGEADSQPTKLLLRDGKVNRPAGCQPVVRMAYINGWDVFALDNITGNMAEYRQIWELWQSQGIPYDYEILASFFSWYNIHAIWYNNNYTWGWFDEDTGMWTGAVGMVSFS